MTVVSIPEPEPTMRMDVAESADGYTLKAELPGVKKEDDLKNLIAYLKEETAK